MDQADVTYRSLRGRHVLVTGAGSGIGLASVQALLAQGCRVSACDLETQAIRATSHRYDDDLHIHDVDVTRPDAVEAWVSAARASHGPIDGLVVSAGIEPDDDAATHELAIDAWERTLQVNLTGAYLSCKHVLRSVLEDERPASIVMIGSPTGYFGLELGHHAYSASKGGAFGLARVMANEYADKSIRVNVVWPGLIDTPMNEFLYRDGPRFASEVEAIPQKRMGHPAEVAAMVLFLLSAQSAYCTGAVFAVDGGLTSR